MRHKTRRAQVEFGVAGLALLRSYPWGDQSNLLQEIIDRLKDEGWANQEVEIEEFDAEAGYRLWAETYDEPGNPLLAVEEPVVRSMIDRLSPKIAVDVACGTGRHAAHLLERGANVIAIDSSPAMLAQARKRLPTADLRAGNVIALPVPDGIADLAVCGLALTHFADLDRPVVELSRVVRRGGRVIVSDIHPFAVATGAHAFFRAADGSRGVVRNHLHWPSDYLKAFRAVGLDVVNCVEPKIDEATVEKINPSPATQHWTRTALLGMPFALIWELEKV